MENVTVELMEAGFEFWVPFFAHFETEVWLVGKFGCSARFLFFVYIFGLFFCLHSLLTFFLSVIVYIVCLHFLFI